MFLLHVNISLSLFIPIPLKSIIIIIKILGVGLEKRIEKQNLRSNPRLPKSEYICPDDLSAH